MKERILILKHSRENPNIIINSNLEFYGACRHKPKYTGTNNLMYVLEEQFAAMDIGPLVHISKHRVLQENIQVDV